MSEPFRDTYEEENRVELRNTYSAVDGEPIIENYELQEHAVRNGYEFVNEEEDGCPKTTVVNGNLEYSVKVTPTGHSIVRMSFSPENELHDNSGAKPWNDIIETISGREGTA
ncbi:hypothetical protein [Candidatus Nanohalococcus occultus]|uniref:Uncharacterized protein n=1 Tax=Candidatus Nanohalococcus occultus TaxID=2978047 RepID=A0ABY8CFC7_9ARCH|nr:hypothetical protein SVXNc_0937 [Candidatus Nanohaloarchaeota archaeon SVXNc]